MIHLTLSTRLSLAIEKCAEWLIPSFCTLCLTKSKHQLCPDCLGSLPLNNGQVCACCDIPLLTNAQLCPDCLTRSPSFDKVITAFKYAFPVDNLILQFKNRHAHHYLTLLCDPLKTRIEQNKGTQMPDIISPVPLHWSRQLIRGYNQSALLAKHLSSELDIPYLPVLKKIRTTPSQQNLNKSQRFSNLKSCFKCTTNVKGKYIVLVDDVVTTGATAQVLAKTLKLEGAKRIEIWALARTPQPHDTR